MEKKRNNSEQIDYGLKENDFEMNIPEMIIWY